jgi:hypothetical protein
METATLTKTEEANVEQMAESFAEGFREPTMAERSKEWFLRSTGEAKREQKKDEGRSRLREINSEDGSDEWREWVKTTGVKATGEKDESATESRRESPAEKDAAKPAGPRNTKAAASESGNSRVESVSGKLTRAEADNHLRQITSGGHPAWQNAVTKVLDEIPAGLRESVIEHFASQPQARQELAKVKNVQELRATVARESMTEMLKQATVKHPYAAEKIKSATSEIVSKAPPFMQAFVNDSEVLGDLLYTLADQTTLNNLLDTAKSNPGKALRVLRDMELDIRKALSREKAPEVRPRAPKPPGQVGFSGNAGDDGTRAANGFTDFSERMQRRYAQAR